MIDDPDAPPARVPEWQRSRRKRLQVALIAGLAVPLIRALLWTVRVEVTGSDHVAPRQANGDRYIIAIWHGRILPGLAFLRDRGIVVITSENFDGEWIARIIRRFGFGTARGSTSRGGARALRELLHTIEAAPVAFTVDGPRGPAGVAQPGVAWLAKASGQPILPFHAEAERCWTLGSWDRTQFPKPFSRVVVSIGAPMFVDADADAASLTAACSETERRIREAEAACDRALGREVAQ